MKKLLLFAMVIALVAVFGACGGNDTTPAVNETPIPEGTPEPTPSPEPTPEPVIDEEPDEPEARVAEIPARPANVVWSLATDQYFQNLEVGTRGAGEDVLESEYWMGAGDPTYRVVDNPLGGVALAVTDRTETWHALDIVTDALGLDGANDYLMTVQGSLASGNFTIGGADSPWAGFHEYAASGDFTTTFLITAEIVAGSGERRHLRLAADNMENLTFYVIEIKRVEADGSCCPDEDEPAEPVEEPEEVTEEPAVAEAPPTPEPAGMPVGFAYSMAHDPYIQGLAAGATTDLAGSLGLRVFNHPDGGGTAVATIGMRGGQRYIRISGRTHQNDGLLLLNSLIQFEQSDRLVIEGAFDNIAYDEGEWFVIFPNADNNGWAALLGADIARWDMCVNEDAPGSGAGPFEFSFSRRFDAPRVDLTPITTDAELPGGIRIQTNRSNSDYDTSDLIFFVVNVERN